MNLWWAFGKQMFATFFFILLMRYYKNAFIAFLLITGCIALHRLTGFLALLYFIISYFISQKKNIKEYLPIFLGACVAFISYATLFYEQVFPYIKSFITQPKKQVFLDGKYGT
jgi:ABC-type siderophore export system fused ATPase/permease subunit